MFGITPVVTDIRVKKMRGMRIMDKRQISVQLELERPVKTDKWVVPIRLTVNLSSFLPDELTGTGVIDLGSIALCEKKSGKSVPYQFFPDQQELGARRKAQGISIGPAARICCRAGVPFDSRGELVFFPSASRSFYLLTFDVICSGQAMQSPYFNYHYLVLDESNRPLPAPVWHMEVSPLSSRNGELHVWQEGKQVATYHFGDGKQGYLYPLRTVDGRNVVSIGRSADPTDSHRHHKGLWFGCRDVNGVNFWEEDGRGVIRHKNFPLLKGGPLTAEIREELEWIQEEEVLLQERRSLTFYRGDESSRLIDVEMRLVPTKDTVIGRNLFGFMAMRGNSALEPLSGGGCLINGNGGISEEEILWKHSPWCCLAGNLVSGCKHGFAIFDHPGNPGYPVAWQARDDGFFGPALACDKEVFMAKDQEFCLRYRILLFQEAEDRFEALVKDTWEGYRNDTTGVWSKNHAEEQTGRKEE